MGLPKTQISFSLKNYLQNTHIDYLKYLLEFKTDDMIK